MTDDATAIHCELASLYVLDSLDGEDLRRFEEHLVDGCMECRLELDTLRSTAELLSLAPEPVAPPASLRDRVLAAARREGSDPIPSPGANLGFEDDGPWKPYSAPGIEYRVLHLDRVAREMVMLVRAQPGSQYPTHHHGAAEDMFMLRGELQLDGATYRPGDFIRSSQGSHHGVGDTTTGCMFLMRGSIDDLVFASGEMNADRRPRLAHE